MRKLPHLGLALLLLATACKTIDKVARDVARLSPQGRRALADFERCEKIAKRLKRFHDSGTLGENDILDILRAIGVVPGKPTKTVKGVAGPGGFPTPEYKGGYRWPLDAGVVSSEYGKRWGKNHNGLDIAADMGKPVYATAPGEVSYAGDQVSGYGNLVVLRHDKTMTSFYGHNKSLKVRTGDKVAADQVIALLGSTGRSTGPHVHFEIRDSDKPLAPRAKLPKSRF